MQATPAYEVAWRVVAASAAGSAHLARGLPCQDAWAWRCLPTGPLLAAVADGAGSAARAELGAALAVEAVMDALVHRWLGAASPLSPPSDAPASVIPFDDAPDHGDADDRADGVPRCCCSATAGGKPSMASTSGSPTWSINRRA